MILCCFEQPNTTLVVGNFKRGQENWTKRHGMSFSTNNESMEKHLKPCTHNTELGNSNSGKFLETSETCRAPHAGRDKKKKPTKFWASSERVPRPRQTESPTSPGLFSSLLPKRQSRRGPRNCVEDCARMLMIHHRVRSPAPAEVPLLL